MTLPIPNRIIRLVFRELLYLKMDEESKFQPIGIAHQNATRSCPFGRNMVDRSFEAIINSGTLESNNRGDSIIASHYRLTDSGKTLIREGNYEEVFKDVITTRKFFFTNNGEYGFSDIYQKNLLKWKLLNYEIDVDPITSEYFEIAKYLNYQIWEEDQVIKMAAKYLGHIRMIQFPSRLIRKLKLEIYERGKEESKLRLLIADSNLRGALMEGQVNEYNPKDYKMRIWQMEHSIIPQILKLLGAKLVDTKRLTNA